MNHLFVPKKLAIELFTNSDFDILCHAWTIEDEVDIHLFRSSRYCGPKKAISLPMYDQVIEWLAKSRDIYICTSPQCVQEDRKPTYKYYFYYPSRNGRRLIVNSDGFATKQDAELHAINNALNVYKNEQKRS